MICTVNGLIHEHYGPLASRRKILARDAGVSERAAENWLLDKNDPQLENVFSIARNNPSFRVKLIAWLEDRS